MSTKNRKKWTDGGTSSNSMRVRGNSDNKAYCDTVKTLLWRLWLDYMCNKCAVQIRLSRLAYLKQLSVWVSSLWHHSGVCQLKPSVFNNLWMRLNCPPESYSYLFFINNTTLAILFIIILFIFVHIVFIRFYFFYFCAGSSSNLFIILFIFLLLLLFIVILDSHLAAVMHSFPHFSDSDSNSDHLITSSIKYLTCVHTTIRQKIKTNDRRKNSIDHLVTMPMPVYEIVQ